MKILTEFKITSPAAVFLTVVAALAVGAHFLHGQGSLTPPAGAPGATMKTLDQVKPGTPIGALPFTISTPGRYYVTGNLSIATSTTAIAISGADVDLDLGNFTLSSTSTGACISITGTRISVHDGSVNGFGGGLSATPTSNELRIENFTVTGCTGTGMLFSNGPGIHLTRSVLRHCRVVRAGQSGIVINVSEFGNPIAQNIIDHCEAIACMQNGIVVSAPGNVIVNCLSSGNATNYLIGANNRMGAIVLPTASGVVVSGSAGGPGSGTTDPFANLSF